jgi:hypothetical protein
MASLKATTKRLQINRANATIAITVAAAAFVATFSLVASRALWSQRGFQGRVIKAKEQARNQLHDNIKAADSLVTSYKDFVGAPNNVLGGNPAGNGERDGDNGRIVLDALPSKYDYPALTTSVEKLITNSNYKIVSVTGTDDEISQKDKQSATTPEPVDMPFTATVESQLPALKDLMNLFERSIRPIHVQSLDLTAGQDKIQLIVSAKSYYQPGKSLNIETKEVK